MYQNIPRYTKYVILVYIYIYIYIHIYDICDFDVYLWYICDFQCISKLQWVCTTIPCAGRRCRGDPAPGKYMLRILKPVPKIYEINKNVQIYENTPNYIKMYMIFLITHEYVC